MAAIWLLETSNDQLVFLDAMQAVPVIVWSDSALQQLPFDIVERLLKSIVDCLDVDRGRGSQVDSSLDSLFVLSAAFLHLYWEKLVVDLDSFQVWSNKFTGSSSSVREHEDLCNALQQLGSNDSIPFAERDLLSLTYFTVQALVKPRRNETFACLRTIGFIPRCQTYSSTRESLRARTAFYLAHWSLGMQITVTTNHAPSRFARRFGSLLFDAIERNVIGGRATGEAFGLYILACATLMGYKIPTSVLAADQ